MNAVASIVLLACLALTYSTNLTENSTSSNGQNPKLVVELGSKKTRQIPEQDTVKNSSTPLKFVQKEALDEDSTKSASSVINQEVVSESEALSAVGAKDKVYTFHVPLNENDSYFGSTVEEARNHKQVIPPFSSKDFATIGTSSNSDLAFENYVEKNLRYKSHKQTSEKEKYKTEENVLRRPYRNESQIQGAGTGFHPHAQVFLQQPQEQYYQHFSPNEAEVEINPVQEILPHSHQVPPQRQLVQQQHFTDGQRLFPAPVQSFHEHIHQKDVAKPLKPSIVHRDPNDFYNHHDQIRTQDKDNFHNFQTNLYPHPGGNSDFHQHYTNSGPYHEVNRFQPYEYDMKKIPECAHKNKHFYNLTFCLEDHLYPLETILWALHQSDYFADKLLADVTYQSADNLVTGLTREEEEGYTYKHYFGATHAQHTALDQYKPPYNGYTYKTDYFKKGGYVCPSDIYYGRPRRAMNTYGQWKVIVNIDVSKPTQYYVHKRDTQKKRQLTHEVLAHKPQYTQTLRLEQCIYPNAPCSYINPIFHSRCIQKHNFVRLVAWTMEEGLHVDSFKLPIACSCHIPQPIHFYQETGHHEEREGSVLQPANNYVDIGADKR